MTSTSAPFQRTEWLVQAHAECYFQFCSLSSSPVRLNESWRLDNGLHERLLQGNPMDYLPQLVRGHVRLSTTGEYNAFRRAMRRATDANPIAIDELRQLADRRFGDMVKAVVDLSDAIAGLVQRLVRAPSAGRRAIPSGRNARSTARSSCSISPWPIPGSGSRRHVSARLRGRVRWWRTSLPAPINMARRGPPSRSTSTPTPSRPGGADRS